MSSGDSPGPKGRSFLRGEFRGLKAPAPSVVTSQGLKPRVIWSIDVRAKARTLQVGPHSGAAKAVPLQKTEFFRSLRSGDRAKQRSLKRIAITK